MVGAIEIKCLAPDALHKGTFEEFLAKPSCYLKKINGRLELKKSHKHYQTVMFVLNIPWCDFIVFHEKFCKIVRVELNVNFMDENLNKAKKFYIFYFLPEVVLRKLDLKYLYY